MTCARRSGRSTTGNVQMNSVSSFFGNGKGQELVGSLRIRPTRRARLRSGTIASNGMLAAARRIRMCI